MMEELVIMHAITGIDDATVVVLMSNLEMNDCEVNKYMIQKGFCDYVYLEGSKVCDHEQGVNSMMFCVEGVPLFEGVQQMEDYYKTEQV